MLAKRLIHGLSLSMDSEEAMINKLKVNVHQISSVLSKCLCFLRWKVILYSASFSLFSASLWLWVHQQASPNVHRHERECRPQQQVQQFYQDTGDGGGPGDQFPDLRITGPAQTTSLELLFVRFCATSVFMRNALACRPFAGWSLASHTRPLVHVRHPSGVREERSDGEQSCWCVRELCS